MWGFVKYFSSQELSTVTISFEPFARKVPSERTRSSVARRRMTASDTYKISRVDQEIDTQRGLRERIVSEMSTRTYSRGFKSLRFLQNAIHKAKLVDRGLLPHIIGLGHHGNDLFSQILEQIGLSGNVQN